MCVDVCAIELCKTKPKLNIHMITFFSIKTDLRVLVIIIIFCVKQG